MSDSALAALIFGLTYLAIASERVDRTAAALAGAVAMIAVKLDGFDQGAAFAAIDFNVIFLLAGMMIQVSVLSRTGGEILIDGGVLLGSVALGGQVSRGPEKVNQRRRVSSTDSGNRSMPHPA